MKKIIAYLLLSLLVFACNKTTEDKKYIEFVRLLNETDTSIIFKSNLTVSEIYNNISSVCNGVGTNYTGDYCLLYDLDKNHIAFVENKDVIKLRFKGFLCPYSTKDIFYEEINIVDKSNDSIMIGRDILLFDSLPSVIKLNLQEKVTLSSYPVLMNIVVEDTIRISELSSVINKVIEGYYLYFKALSNTLSSSVFLEKTPLKMRITPQSYNMKSQQEPTPYNEISK